MRSVNCIVVHHRGSDMLSASLQSVLASEGVDVAVTVVANNCQEELPGWIEDHKKVSVVRPDAEMGFSEANNHAVGWAEQNAGTPDAFFFFNNDAAVDPQTLALLTDVLFSSPAVGAVGPKILIWGASDHLNSLGLNVTEFAEAWDEGIGRLVADVGPTATEREVLALTGAALMVRSDAFHQIGGWPEIYRYYMEDIDLCLRLRSRGWTVVNVAEAVAYHAISATSDSTADMKRFYSWRNQFLVIIIHWPWRLLVAVVPRLAAVQFGTFLRRLRARAHSDARLQAKAWWGAFVKFPGALIERRRARGRNDWTRFLVPAGTVPVIELPVVVRKPWDKDLEPVDSQPGPSHPVDRDVEGL